ncbi:Vacuolar protein sorting-associated protein 51 [Mortierella sp. AD010]|nr:Vacuolar protein sorting-associated protein 51 [Mortierella sp. AD010]
MPIGDGDAHPPDASSITRQKPTAATATSTATAAASGAAGTAAVARAGAGATTTRRRAKSFLRNYYGIQQADAANQDGSKEGSSAQTGQVSKTDPYDLDSHAFEVDKYMHKMFVEKQLPGLVQADNELVADIRQLDGDMKTLVYENYSKFLSATDTINKMKSNVDNLESEMSRLTQNISKIATSSSAIHSSLGSKREKIRQLNGVHSLLTKLQFVFELPTNLHQCLEAESYTQAVKSYRRTLHLFQHYRHLSVFTGIERECKTIMVQIAQRIRQKMCAEQATITEISECVGLLLALQEDPVALWKQYLDLSMSCLRKLNTKTLDEIKSLPLYIPPAVTSPKSAQTPTTPRKTPKKSKNSGTSAAGVASATTTPKGSKSKAAVTAQAPAPPSPADKVSYLNAYYLKQVEGFVVSFRNYYLVPPTGLSGTSSGGGASTSATAEDEVTLDKRPPAWVSKDSRVYANLTTEQQEEASVAVKGAVSKIVSNYLDTIGSFLDYPDDIFSVKPEVHVHVLQNLYLGTIASNGLCQLVGFDALATGLIQNWETQLIHRALGKVKEGLMDRIAKQDIELTKSKGHNNETLDVALGESDNDTATAAASGLTTAFNETTLWLQDVFKLDTIPFLEKCMSSDAQFLETKEGRTLFLQNFQNNFKAFWDEALKEMRQRSGVSAARGSGSSSRTLSLVMSHLCFELSNSVVEQMYKTSSRTLFRPGKRTRPGSFLIESYEEPPVIPQLQWDCKSVVQSCQETGHVLLDNFIARTGNELSWLVMDVQSLIDYMGMNSPPTGVSDTWERIYKELNEVEHQVIAVYGDEGDRLGNHEISSESIRRESVFKPGGGSNNGNNSNSRRNDSLASFGSNTMNSRFENQQRNLLLSNIDKLFSDRVEIFIRCQDLNRTGIMFGIIKILLKAWAETVRMKTFGKGGFQQVQVDAEFAKVWLWRFATADERLMHSLLEETQQTAYRRCIDAAPLDMNTVETIINSTER